jgi:hypothetical protein
MKTTIDMAREAELVYWSNGRWWMDAGEPGDELKDFEALVRADERAQAAAQPVQEPVAYTTGRCIEKAKPGGCQLHNLHCNFPACDRKES